MTRNSKRRQRRTPVPSKSWQKKYWLPLTIVGIICLAFTMGMIAWYVLESLTKTTPTAKGSEHQNEKTHTSTATLPRQQEISEGRALAMYEQLIRPFIKDLALQYPVESVRQEFSRAMADVGNGRSVGIHPCGFLSGTALASTLPINKDFSKPVIYVYMTQWVSMCAEDMAKRSAPDGAGGALEDNLVLVFLHQYYHGHDQEYWKKDPRSLTSVELVEGEAECWHYTFQNVLGPMLKHGYGKHLEPCILDLYRRWLEEAKQENADTWHDIMGSWLEEPHPAFGACVRDMPSNH